jgi:hypothetical protein
MTDQLNRPFSPEYYLHRSELSLSLGFNNESSYFLEIYFKELARLTTANDLSNELVQVANSLHEQRNAWITKMNTCVYDVFGP